MGLTQSTTIAPIVNTTAPLEVSEPQKPNETTVETTIETTKLSENSLPENVESVNDDNRVKDVTTPTPNSTPILKSVEEGKAIEVLERYVEPPGTKVEVAPVDVAPAEDVVKKSKRKHKKTQKQ